MCQCQPPTIAELIPLNQTQKAITHTMYLITIVTRWRRLGSGRHITCKFLPFSLPYFLCLFFYLPIIYFYTIRIHLWTVLTQMQWPEASGPAAMPYRMDCWSKKGGGGPKVAGTCALWHLFAVEFEEILKFHSELSFPIMPHGDKMSLLHFLHCGMQLQSFLFTFIVFVMWKLDENINTAISGVFLNGFL